ncbi:MAG TPA: serine hydrolase [Longimicrobiales bacterium]
MIRSTRLLPALLLACVAACDAPVERGDAREVDAFTPPTTGLDSALVEAARARLDSLVQARSLLVARHGELHAEYYFNGRDGDDFANLKSVSKSILSALVGIAIAEGHLSGVEQPVAPFFAAELPRSPDPRIHEVTIGDLLSMRAGLEPTSFGSYGEWVSSPDWVRYALAQGFVDEPGGRMLYSTGNTHLLSAILTRATGMDTWSYARAKLGDPLGIEIPRWQRDPQGFYFGGNDMLMRPRDLLRIGELYRRGGEWDGRQVVPAEWVEQSLVVRTRSPWNGNGYGYGWWSQRIGRRIVHFAWGYGGQYLFLVPDLDLTIVVTSDPAPRQARGDYRAELFASVRDVIRAAELGR